MNCRVLNMRKQIAAIKFWAFVTILFCPIQIAAYENQSFENNKDICRFHTSIAEKKFGIPKHLLTAISLAESGRWNKKQKENIAWPWTITSEGQGRFYNTKAEALAEIEALISRGIKNIDVGCMQVNLYYHGSKFKNYSEVLEPIKNITYAANFLKKLYSSSRKWADAVGNYHSTTPTFNKAYRSKVLSYLPKSIHKLKDRNNRNFSLIKPPAPIDYQRMAKLNASFQARIKSQSQNNSLNSTNKQQLDAWRDARTKGEGMALFLAKRRAMQKLKEKLQIEELIKGGNSQTFAQRRTQQLNNWRLGKPENLKKDSWRKTWALQKN